MKNDPTKQIPGEVTPPFVRSPYNYNTNKASDESALACADPSRAQQHMKDEADINTIVERFKLTGQMPTNVRMPTSGDFTNVPSFQEAMDAVVAARESFDKLPAKVRARFHNDPAELVAFCDDKENIDEARKLGLVPAKELPKAPAEISPAPTPSERAQAFMDGKKDDKGKPVI